MITSESGISNIEGYEGTILHGYIDSTGHLTIGTGHLVRPAEPYIKGTVITQAQADSLLHSDLKGAEYTVSKAINIPLKQSQFDALVSLAFNIGCHAFAGSHLVASINARRPLNIIRLGWVEWDKSGGSTLEALVSRRASEYKTYIS